MDSPADPAGVAREEAARQAVLIVGSLIFVVLGVLAQRWMADPDMARTGRMRFFRSAERFCAVTAGKWWRLAERYRLMYEKDST